MVAKRTNQVKQLQADVVDLTVARAMVAAKQSGPSWKGNEVGEIIPRTPPNTLNRILAKPGMEIIRGHEVRKEFCSSRGGITRGMMRRTLDIEGVECELEIDFTIDNGVVTTDLRVPADQKDELCKSFIRALNESGHCDDAEEKVRAAMGIGD